MKEQVVLEVQQSLVRQTDGAYFTLSSHNAHSVSYSFGIVVRDSVFLLGRVYIKAFIKLFKNYVLHNRKGLEISGNHFSQLLIGTVLFGWGDLLWYKLTYFASGWSKMCYTCITSICCNSCCWFGTRHSRVSRHWASFPSLLQLHHGMDSPDVSVQVCGGTCSYCYFYFTVKALCSAIPNIFKLQLDAALFTGVSRIYAFLRRTCTLLLTAVYCLKG